MDGWGDGKKRSGGEKEGGRGERREREKTLVYTKAHRWTDLNLNPKSCS